MALYAFDGTWNSSVVDDDVQEADDTNVVRFYEACRGRKWYVSGPGTRRGAIGKKIGGLTGAGARDRLEEAYKALVAAYAQGDTAIDIVGFSRGAAIALDFANLIHETGIQNPESGEVIAKNVSVRFVGLWDVVGSFGVPIGQMLFQKLNLGHELHVPKNVEYAYHALALDERRQSFAPTRQTNAYEVWFRGVHSDIGGGNGNAGLSAIALRWMLCKAVKVGLPIADDAIAKSEALIDRDAALVLPKDVVSNDYRAILRDDRFHHSVSDRPGHHNAPSPCLRESEADELEAVACAMFAKR